jgi:hypothetical protein
MHLKLCMYRYIALTPAPLLLNPCAIVFHAHARSDLFCSTDGMILLADTFPREWLSPLKDTAAPTTPTTSADAALYA